MGKVTPIRQKNKKKHVCHARCLSSPPERVFTCKCPCNGEHHGTAYLAKLPWHERQKKRTSVRNMMQTQLGYLDRKTEHASFIKESTTTAEMVAAILSFEPKKRLAAKR